MTKKTKVYLAGAISDIDRKAGQKRTAQLLIDMGYDVYAAANNDSINDKSNNPTPLDIYNGDIERIKECDIFVVRISGSGEDGTLSEIGMVAGWNEMIDEYNSLFEDACDKLEIPEQYRFAKKKPVKIIAYSTNERLLTPQFWNGIPSASFNHLICGMLQKHGVFVGTEQDMLEYMKKEII